MKLTQKEFEVLGLLCEGKSDEEIDETLYVSISTIRTHVHNLLTKLHLRNRTQLVIYALKDREIHFKMYGKI